MYSYMTDADRIIRRIYGNMASREDRWSVPLVAIREALMNAIVHADCAQQGAPIRLALFDDRIEIENPGLLPSGLTIEDIRQGVSKLRNRVIGRVFHELHLIEQWGSGVQRMTSTCQAAGLNAPKLEEIGIHFRVTISNAGRPAPHGRDGPAHPGFVRGWRCAVDCGRGETCWTFPTSHSDTAEVHDRARASC
jgi:predicted HTH transcriptional regulator